VVFIWLGCLHQLGVFAASTAVNIRIFGILELDRLGRAINERKMKNVSIYA
jgi:hypothetical protein